MIIIILLQKIIVYSGTANENKFMGCNFRILSNKSKSNETSFVKKKKKIKKTYNIYIHTYMCIVICIYYFHF